MPSCTSEVARAMSRIGEFTLIEDITDTIDDGYFEIETPNLLEIVACDLVNEDFEFRHIDDQNLITSWVALVGYVKTLSVNTPITIDIPSKNFAYTLWIVPKPVPKEIETTDTILTKNGISIVSESVNIVEWDSLGYSIEFVEASDYEYVTIPGTLNKADIDNCGGNTVLERKYEKSQVYVLDFEVDVAIDALIPLGVLNTLVESELHYENGRMESEAVNMPLMINPSEHVVFEISWREIWQPYTLEVTDIRSNVVTKFDFDIKLGAETTVSSSKIPCV
jgi:hypothetical protein